MIGSGQSLIGKCEMCQKEKNYYNYYNTSILHGGNPGKS